MSVETARQILKRDRSVSMADQRERSKGDAQRSQHELSCPAIGHRTTGGGDLVLANDRRLRLRGKDAAIRKKEALLSQLRASQPPQAADDAGRLTPGLGCDHGN
jgi:hypothetical protein